MAIKLIVTDLDGTLMAADHLTVTQRTKDALKSAHDMGVKIAIATGRTLALTQNVTKQIPFADYVIYSNGAAVYDRKQGKDIYKNCISVEHTSQILNELEKVPVYYNVFSDGKIYIHKDRDSYYKEDNLPIDFLREVTRISVQSDNMPQTLFGKQAEILALYSMHGELKEHFISMFKSMGLYLTASLPNEIEATAQNVNKGTALEGFCKEIEVLPDEVMAFGDAMNDYEMLKFAGYSFAMGNAVQQIKEVARYTTLTNAEDGLAVAVEKYLLDK